MTSQIEKLTQGILSLCSQIIEFDIELKVTGFIKVIADEQIALPIQLKETIYCSELTSNTTNKPHRSKWADASNTLSDDNLESNQELQIKVEEPEDEKKGEVSTPSIENMIGKKRNTQATPASAKTARVLGKIRKRPLMKSMTVLYDEKDKVSTDIMPLPEHISDITPVFPCLMCRLPPSSADVDKKSDQGHDPDTTIESITNMDREHHGTVEHSNPNGGSSVSSNKIADTFRTFETEEELLSHGKSYHKDVKTFECLKCSQIVSSFQKFHQHLYMKHEDIKNYSCKICSKCFVWGAHVVKHAEIHGTRKYICHVCPGDVTFFKLLEYRNHMKVEHTEVTCEHCRFVSSSQKTHIEHMKLIHPDKSIPAESMVLQVVSPGEVPKPQAVAAEAGEDIRNKVFVTKRMTKQGRPFKVTGKGNVVWDPKN